MKEKVFQVHETTIESVSVTAMAWEMFYVDTTHWSVENLYNTSVYNLQLVHVQFDGYFPNKYNVCISNEKHEVAFHSLLVIYEFIFSHLSLLYITFGNQNKRSK